MGLFMIVMIANFGFIMMVSRGTGSLVGRHFGAGQKSGASVSLARGLGLAWKVAIPLAVIEWIYAPEILHVMGGRGETIVV